MHRRHEDAGLDVGEQFGIDERRGAVGAHASGVRPLVAVIRGLVVLQRRQRDDRAAVGDRHHAHLHAVESLLDQDSLGCGRKLRVATERFDRRERRLPIRAHEHPLAGGEAVGLHHDRHVFTRFEKLAGGGHRPEFSEHRGRHVAAVQNLFAEQLAAFELGCPGRGAEDAQTGRRECVDDPRHERRLGPHDSEIDAAVTGHAHQCGHVGGGNGNVFRDLCRASIARGHEHLGTVAAQLPGQGMLPSATAHDQHTAGWGHGSDSFQRALAAAVHTTAQTARRRIVAGSPVREQGCRRISGETELV